MPDGKKVVANGDEGILLSPATFARHDAAIAYVEGEIRTRAPRPGTTRSPGLAPGAWGLLAAGDTITAGSGVTLGTGSVKLCDRDGTVYAADESADVANAGEAIAAGGADLLVGLDWVEGEWAACGCVATLAECGVTCGSCVGHKMPTMIEITDDNGTWLAGPSFTSGGNSFWTTFGYKTISPVYAGGAACTGVSARCAYVIGLKCFTDGTGFQITRTFYLTSVGGGFCCDGTGLDALTYKSAENISGTCVKTSQTAKFTISDCFDPSWSGSMTLSPFDPFGSAASVAWTTSLGQCQAFQVIGCNGLGLAGATVNVRASSGGTILGTTTTAENGYAYLSWGGSNAIYLEVTRTRFASYGASLTITPAATTTVTLSAGSGYHCIAGCVQPIADTLHATHPKLGAITYTYSAGNWVASSSYAYPGVGACPPLTLSVTCTWNGSTGYTESWKYAGTNCPNDAGPNTATATWTSGALACYVPSVAAFQKDFTITAGTTPLQNLYGATTQSLSIVE